MVKPLGVLFVFGIVAVLILCLLLVLWWFVQCMRMRARKEAVLLGIAALGIAVVSAWAVYWVAPKGARTIAELTLPDGRAFVVRHCREGWTEYPKVRFYARDTDGTWTSFALIAELVNPNSTSLVLDESAQEVHVPSAGWYRIQEHDFVVVDGDRAKSWQLPPGVEPGEEEID